MFNRPLLIASCVLLARVANAGGPSFQVIADYSQAPEVKQFADTAQTLVNQWYLLINDILFGADQPLPYQQVKLVFRHGSANGNEPAATSGNTITFTAEYIVAHPDDLGMVIHELTHVAQAYKAKNPETSWITEGIADYIRYRYYDRTVDTLRIDPGDPRRYTAGYKPAAALLLYMEKKDQGIVRQLNVALREGSYSPDIFNRDVGETLDQLWAEAAALSPPGMPPAGVAEAKASGCVPKGTDKFVVNQFSASGNVLGGTQRSEDFKEGLVTYKNWCPGSSGLRNQETVLTVNSEYNEKKNGAMTPSITRVYYAKFQQFLFLPPGRSAYLYATGDVLHNNSLGVYLQQSYGGGGGVLLPIGVELDGDIRYLGEHFYSPGQNVGLVGANLAARYSIPLSFITKGTTLTETAIAVPVFNESKAWQLHDLLDLSIPISPKWSFTALAQDDYLRNAPHTFRRNFVSVTFGIKFTKPK